MSDSKKCNTCHEVKSLDDFHRDRSRRPQGRADRCKSCAKEMTRQWREKYPEKYEAQKERKRRAYRNNPDYWKKRVKKHRDENPRMYRDRHLQRLYGITVEEFEFLLEWQGGACAICRQNFGTTSPHIDHDHDSGAVRGLLCSGCNTAIGLAKEDPEVLRLMADYVELSVPALSYAGFVERSSM